MLNKPEILNKPYTQLMYSADLVEEINEEEWTNELAMYFVIGSWIKRVEVSNYPHKYPKGYAGMVQVAEC